MESMIFARATRSPPTEIPLSAAAIAASVRRPAELQAGEAQLRSLRQDRQRVVDETRALIAARTMATETVANRSIAALERRRLDLEAQIKALRARVIEMRSARLPAVVDALAPMRREAANRVLAALAELRGAVAVLDAVAVEIGKAGCETQRMPMVEAGDLELQARRAAR